MSAITTFDTSFTGIVTRLLDRFDSTEGSVARTLLETVAREMAVSYQALDLAYRSSFLDTAEGQALDHVVSVLGVTRARAGRLTGQVEFSRVSPAPADIIIPAGRLITSSSPAVQQQFETAETGILRRGDLRTLVPVQEVLDDKKNETDKKDINPGELNVMPRPVLGIDQVSNPAPLRRTSEDESDEHLRARARTALRDQESGTLAAIQAAILEQGVKQVTVREPLDGPPGIVEVIIDDPDFKSTAGLSVRVEDAIRKTKAAGIRVKTFQAKRVLLQPSFQVEPTDDRMDDAAFDSLRRSLEKDLEHFAALIPVGAPVSKRRLESILFSNPAVRYATPVKMTAWIQGKNDLEKLTLREERDDEWTIDAYHAATIDLVKKPPIIMRYGIRATGIGGGIGGGVGGGVDGGVVGGGVVGGGAGGGVGGGVGGGEIVSTLLRLDMEVTIASGDRRTGDEVRQDVRAVIATYEEQLKIRRDAAVLSFDVLEKDLQEGAGILKLSRLDVTRGQKPTESLSNNGTIPLGDDTWALQSGNITYSEAK